MLPGWGLGAGIRHSCPVFHGELGAQRVTRTWGCVGTTERPGACGSRSQTGATLFECQPRGWLLASHRISHPWDPCFATVPQTVVWFGGSL